MTEAEISGQKRNSFNKGKVWKAKTLLLCFCVGRKNFNTKTMRQIYLWCGPRVIPLTPTELYPSATDVFWFLVKVQHTERVAVWASGFPRQEPNLAISLRLCLIALNISRHFKSFAASGPPCVSVFGAVAIVPVVDRELLHRLNSCFQTCFQICSLVHMSSCYQIASPSRISTVCFKYLDWDSYRKWSANGMKQMYSSYRNHSLHKTNKHGPLPTIWFTFLQLRHNICCKDPCRERWENMLNTNTAERRIKPFQT